MGSATASATPSLQAIQEALDRITDETKPVPDVVLCHISVREALQRQLDNVFARIGEPGFAPRCCNLYGIPIWTHHGGGDRTRVLLELERDYRPWKPLIMEITETPAACGVGGR